MLSDPNVGPTNREKMSLSLEGRIPVIEKINNFLNSESYLGYSASGLLAT